MAFNKKQFRNLIEYTLSEIDMESPAAVNLLMGTAAQESHLGTYLRQINGSALGVFQMEPATHDDIWGNYLEHRIRIYDAIFDITNIKEKEPIAMVYNLRYAIAMARVHYLRVPEALPDADDIESLGRYWKHWYNTRLGKGTVKEFVENYTRFVVE